MHTLYHVRHGPKEGIRYDPAQRNMATEYGRDLAFSHKDSSIDARCSRTDLEPNYPGRTYETAELVLIGAGMPYGSVPSYDDRLNSDFAPDLKKALGKEVSERKITFFQALFENDYEGLINAAVENVECIEDFMLSSDADIGLNVGHEPVGTSGIVYILTRDYDLANHSTPFLKGTKVEKKDGVYIVTFDSICYTVKIPESEGLANTARKNAEILLSEHQEKKASLDNIVQSEINLKEQDSSELGGSETDENGDGGSDE
ncbi:MAG: hypothetical protein ACMXYG_04645 [Candidatus Woesearchaeota archaeon]